MIKKRITESELILPSLYLMTLNPQGSIKTSELIPMLTQMLKPKGVDAEILDNRNDTYFSQKVRNLKSHDTLTRYGYAEYRDGTYFITNIGRELVENNRINIQYLLSSGFDYIDVKTSLGMVYNANKTTIIPYDEIVSEGETKTTMTKSYERSNKLRNAAIDYFTVNGIIICDCCGFEFKSFYGETYGTSCIEIHHMKPIFHYDGESIEQTIDEALKNLLPVCPNCHRVIHRNNITADLIPSFKKELNNRIYGKG